MKNSHPTENDIQTHVLNNLHDSKNVEHISNCIHCGLIAKQYKHLFADIQKQDVPTFEFNLSQLVMEELESKTEAKLSFDNYLNYFLSISIGLLFLILLYLVTPYISVIFVSTSPLLTYLISICAVCFSLFFSVDTYKSYRKKISLLNAAT